MTSILFTIENEVRAIESVAPPLRYARGWHSLGLADGFRDGKPWLHRATQVDRRRRTHKADRGVD